MDSIAVSWTPAAWRAGDMPAPRWPPPPAEQFVHGESQAPPPDWDKKLEEHARAAAEAALREGERLGYQRARSEFEPIEKNFQRSIAEIAELRPRLRRQAERQVVELALAVARRILRRQVTVDPEAVAGLVRSAVDSISLREIVQVRIHPSQQRSVSEALDRLGAPGGLRIEGDPSLEAGALVIETDRGAMDCSVFTQLDEIERGFTDVIGEGDYR